MRASTWGFSRRVAQELVLPDHRRLGGHRPRNGSCIPPNCAIGSHRPAARPRRRSTNWKRAACAPSSLRRCGLPINGRKPWGVGRKMNYTLSTVINSVIRIFSLLILIEVIGSWVMLMRLKLPDFVYDLLRACKSITRRHPQPDPAASFPASAASTSRPSSRCSCWTCCARCWSQSWCANGQSEPGGRVTASSTGRCDQQRCVAREKNDG